MRKRIFEIKNQRWKKLNSGHSSCNRSRELFPKLPTELIVKSEPTIWNAHIPEFCMLADHTQLHWLSTLVWCFSKAYVVKKIKEGRKSLSKDEVTWAKVDRHGPQNCQWKRTAFTLNPQSTMTNTIDELSSLNVASMTISCLKQPLRICFCANSTHLDENEIIFLISWNALWNGCNFLEPFSIHAGNDLNECFWKKQSHKHSCLFMLQFSYPAIKWAVIWHVLMPSQVNKSSWFCKT